MDADARKVDVVNGEESDSVFLDKEWAKETDHVTGLPNRLYLKNKIPELLKQNENSQYSILLISIDNFVGILPANITNDLLRKLAEVLQPKFLKEDLLVRFEEAIFLIISEIEIESLRLKASQIIEEVKNPITDDPLDLFLSGLDFSFGVASFTGHLGADVLHASRLSKEVNDI